MKRSLFFFSGEPGNGPLARRPTQLLVNQIDAPGLRRAGVRMVGAALWPPPALRPGRGPLAEAIIQLRELERFGRRAPDFGLALDAASARRVMASGGIALVPSLEGGEAIASVADVDVLFAAGMRTLGLVHFSDNALAGARDDQLGRLLGLVLDGPADGLTPFGREVVGRLFDLGVVVDVDHCSAQTVEDVLQLAEARHVPVIASHIGATLQGRSLGDEHARRILALGGLLGVGIYRHALLAPMPEGERWPGYAPGTCDDVVAHWLHYSALGPPGAVMLGSDLSNLSGRPLPGGLCPDGIAHAGDLPGLFLALVDRGIEGEQLDASAERYVALLERVEAAADPRVRARALETAVPRPGSFDVP